MISIIVILGMGIFLILLIGGLVWAVKEDSKTNSKNEVKKTLIEAQAEEKQKNNQKILEMLVSKEKITNKEVEQALGVSDATATRYLDELEKSGVIKQVGTDGPLVHYTKI